MYTKTITLSGAALSSFLAAGGQTVNPNAAAATPAAAVQTTSAVAQVAFPTIVETPTAAAAAAVQTTSTRAGLAAVATTSTTTTTSSSIPTTSSIVPTTSSVVSKTSSSVVTTAAASAKTTSSSQITSLAKSTSKAATSSARVSSVRSAAADALSASKAKASSGIGGGGIAGIIIGLLILFGIAGALLFFWRKRRNERREEEWAEKSRRDARNEKGMVRLEEQEISTPTSGGGFDFGLPTASTPPVLTDDSTFTRSASPAQMQQGAAILGIQRPFTPPPGHPAHPNYRQPPALVANRQAQQPPQGVRSITPQAMPNMPRKPVQASTAPMQRKLSSNNPFSDPPAMRDVAPPLARSASPAPPRVSSPPIIPMPATINAEDPRASVASFTAGDDSAHEEEDTVAPLNDVLSPKSSTPPQTSTAFTAPPPQPSDAPAAEDDSVIRSKSVQRASDNWAARKAHLKNTLALQTGSNPTSPAADQSPFADPAPTIDHEIAAVSPMQMNFDRDSQKF